jgi:flagellar basal-body rod modification protein FlgD
MASEIFSTPNIWPNYSAENVARASNKKQELGKDQFLSILIKQLQNQDPMQPMEDKEFIAQMAQFTSVEQLINISKQLNAMSQSLGNVSGLIGKEISWIDDANKDQGGESKSEMKSGVVDSIIVKDGVQYASVGSLAIPLDKVIEIKEASKTEEHPAPDQTPPADDPKGAQPAGADSNTDAPGSGESA